MSTDDQFDAVFKALANPLRRRICDELKLRPLTTGQLCDGFPEVDRCTVMQHLKVLERAGLVVPVRKGRERVNHLHAQPIPPNHQRPVRPHPAPAASRLSALKQALELDPAGEDA